MYRVIIADDEPIALEHISSIIEIRRGSTRIC